MPILLVTMATLQISAFDTKVLKEIERFGKEGIFITNEEFAERMSCSMSYIQQSTAKLRNMGLITIKRMSKQRNRFKKVATYTVVEE